ncbi:MAG: tRNA pseudouridine(13) synthase TruD [Nanoarchaeota archaeon]
MVKIKQVPEDFIVEEIPKEIVFGSGGYSYYWMRKKGLSTHDAAEIVAKQLGLRINDIGFAGAKDKKAVTSQMISIKGKFSREILPRQQLFCEFKGFAEEPVSLGEHNGNIFTITLRDIAEFEADNIIKNADKLRYLDFLLPNYFDEQRFSSTNIEIGIALLKKNYPEAVRLIEEQARPDIAVELKDYLHKHPHDFVGALRLFPRRVLMLYVHSVQSHLFNEIVNTALDGMRCAVVPYSRGEFLFPAVAVEQKECVVPGFMAEDPLVKELLSRHNLSEDDFINRSLPQLSAESSTRTLLMKVENFTISEFNDDEFNQGKKKVVISFKLGRGSYATIVCKFLTAAYD